MSIEGDTFKIARKRQALAPSFSDCSLLVKTCEGSANVENTLDKI